jgi:hypothetical protein
MKQIELQELTTQEMIDIEGGNFIKTIAHIIKVISDAIVIAVGTMRIL